MAVCFRRMSIVGCQPVLPDPFGTRVPVIVCLERSRNPLSCSLFGGQRTFGRRLLQRLFHLRTHHKQTSSSQLTITTLFRNKNPNCLLAFYSSDGCTVTSVLRGRPPPPPPPPLCFLALSRSLHSHQQPVPELLLTLKRLLISCNRIFPVECFTIAFFKPAVSSYTCTLSGG